MTTSSAIPADEAATAANRGRSFFINGTIKKDRLLASYKNESIVDLIIAAITSGIQASAATGLAKGEAPGVVNDFHHPYRLPERHADPGVIASESGSVALAEEAVDLVLTGHRSRVCTPVTVKAFPEGVKDLFMVHLVVRIPVRIYSDVGEPDGKKAVPVDSPYHVRQLGASFRLADSPAVTGKQADRLEQWETGGSGGVI
jgi:hypothetical protein